MPMIHHDNRPYAVAVSESAKKFKQRLEERFHASVPRVTRVIEQVQQDVPEDMIVNGNQLRFDSTNGTISILPPEHEALTVHKHALYQIAGRVKYPGEFMNRLLASGEWGSELVAHNLNELYGHLNGNKFLVRSVRSEARGFLSDAYRRLDSRPLLEAFVGAMQKFGARPIDGFALETKIRVRCFLPMIFEPFPGEIMAIGAELGDSDYGDGYLTLSGIVERMICTNLATTMDVLHQVHLGKRLPDNIHLSQRTYQLDTKAMASAVNDLASHVLGPAATNTYLDLIRTANEQKLEPSKVTAWVKKNLNKGEGEKLIEKFNSADVEMLPPGNTTWRWSNAISWLANETEDEHRRLELQDLAGEVIHPGKEAAKQADLVNAA